MVATVVAPRLTAAQVILMAADDLMTGGSREFTEWELTVASWNRDKARFGLRGYDQTYPDHKRVMMEIMGKKPQNPVTLGLMEKIRPNVYRLTARSGALVVGEICLSSQGRIGETLSCSSRCAVALQSKKRLGY